MKLFSLLYDRVLSWSRHPRATWYLAAMAFAESSFFPIPPDVMLAPMVLSRPQKAWYLATVTSVASVFGGVLGYAIGALLFTEIAQPLIAFYHVQADMLVVENWFRDYGVWIVFIAGFSPLPYKVFTISAGLMAMAVLPFIVASAVGRSTRFFLVAGLIHWGGEKFEHSLRRYIDILGWLTVSVIVLGIVYFKYSS